MTSFVQKTCEKDVVGIVTFVPDWFTSHQSQYCLYYNGIPGSAVARPNGQLRQAGVARGVRGHAPPPPRNFEL